MIKFYISDISIVAKYISADNCDNDSLLEIFAMQSHFDSSFVSKSSTTSIKLCACSGAKPCSFEAKETIYHKQLILSHVSQYCTND